MILLIPVIGFLIGVAVQSVAPIDIYTAGAVLVGGGAVALVAGVRTQRTGLILALAVAALVCGVVRTEYARSVFTDALVFHEGEAIASSGTVRNEPDIRETYMALTITLDTRTETGTDVVVRARVPHYPAYRYGDRVEVRGILEYPEAFETDSGRVFDYRGYLMKEGVHYEVRNAELLSLREQRGNPIVRSLLTLKDAWLAGVSRVIAEPSSSLLGGVVVGAKRSLGDAWLDAFRTTGIVHIVVLSGYNLTLVALFIVWVTRRLSRTARLGAGIASIIAFALMTGGGATVVRASIMAILGMIALFLGRPYVVMRALVVAGVAMIISNPFVLVFDSGFQLSFVATIGLVLGTPLIERHLTWITDALNMRTIVATTFATQIAVLPLLLYHIGEISLVAPIVNILVLPVVPLMMALGFASGLLAMVLPVVAAPLAWITTGTTSYVFAIVYMFDRIPFASSTLPPVPFAFVVVLYALICTYGIGAYKKSSATQGVSQMIV